MNAAINITLALFLVLAFTGFAQAKEKVSLKAGGLTLNANLELAKNKKLSDGVILLTHGTLAHNEMEIIKTLQELLKERGHNTLAINLSLGIDNRGASMYDCKTPHKHHHLDAVDEIATWVNWLKSKGAGKISVLGHSRGGNQTARYAAGKPDAAVDHVILVAPATWSQKYGEDSYEKSYKTKLGPLLDRAQNLTSSGKGSEMLENIGIIYCANTKATASAFVSYNKPDPARHTPNVLKDIKIPTMVIAGANDKVVKGLPEAVSPFVDGKNLQLKMIEDADHFFQDFAAEEVADHIDEFIKN
ncbi:MAG: alpha/beta hydrolase [bacterium]|nr:alpha/beta hydrolase [bacterium]